MTFIDHFSSLASQYSAYRPSYPAELFDYIVGLCVDRRQAWDCACGSGQATMALATRFNAVLGTDASAQQVAAATPAANITYRVATAQSSGLDSASTDLVTVAQALHWLDLDAFYGEVDRVLLASGVLAVWTYGVLHVEGSEIDAHVQEFYNEIIGPYWPAERKLVEEGYRSLRLPFAEIATPVFDMRERWQLAHLMGYLRSWSATGRYVEHNGVDPVVALQEKLQPIWGEDHCTRLVTWPLSLRASCRSR
jgi:SAM-dependent methyltransferase